MKALIANIQENIFSFKMEHQFRDGQEIMFDGIMRALSDGIVRMYGKAPTGAGKTFIQAQTANAVIGSSNIRVLVITSRVKIMNQILSQFGEFAPQHKTTLYGDSSKDLSGDIVIVSYHGYLNLTKKQRDQFQVVLLDEAHHALGPKTKARLQLHSKSAILIGFTATDEYSEQKSLKRFLKNRVFNISIVEAIHLGLIAPIQLCALRFKVDIKGQMSGELKSTFEKRIVLETEKYGTNEFYIKLYIQVFRPLGIRTTLFTVNKDQANDLLKHCQNHGVSARTIFDTTPRTIRKEIFDTFEKSDFEILIAIDVPGEGWDDVGLGCVMMTYPSQSMVDVTQKYGRSSRINPLNPNKVSYAVISFFEGAKQVYYSDIVNQDLPEEEKSLFHQSKNLKKRGTYKRIAQKDLDAVVKENSSITQSITVEYEEFLMIQKEVSQIEKKVFLSYEELKKQVNEAKVQSRDNYREVYKNHQGWPSIPSAYYSKSGWISWSEFLGTNSRRRTNFISYKQCKKQVNEAGIRFKKEYGEVYKNHKGWPSSPYYSYSKKGWVNWPTFLGVGSPVVRRKRRDAKNFLSYEKCKKQVNDAEISSSTIYYEVYSEYTGWPRNPDQFFADTGWVDWSTFLENGTKSLKNRESSNKRRRSSTSRNFLDYSECKKSVQLAKVKSRLHYEEIYIEYDNWPSSPHKTYKNKGWTNWSEFLGTINRAKDKIFLSYGDLRKEVQLAGINSRLHYEKVYKDHSGWPSAPHQYYKERGGWLGWTALFAKES